jgi:hypothetical protein
MLNALVLADSSAGRADSLLLDLRELVLLP